MGTLNMSATRRFVVLSALTSPIACQPGTCSPSSTHSSELRFFQDGLLIDDVATLGYATFNTGALQPLPSVPLESGRLSQDISGQYSLAPVDSAGLPGQSIEAHLFVADLSATNTGLRAIPAAETLSCSGSCWDDLTTASEIGGAAVLPYPPNADWDTTLRYDPGPLFHSYFWPTTNPAAPASAPSGTGSVKSVRMYKPGLCGLEVPFTKPDASGIFDQVSDPRVTHSSTRDRRSETTRA